MSTPISEKEGEEAKRELKALKAMVEGDGWKNYFAPKLAGKERDRLAGLVAVGVEPVKRSEHLFGYHDAVELREWATKRIEALEEKVRKYNRQ